MHSNALPLIYYEYSDKYSTLLINLVVQYHMLSEMYSVQRHTMYALFFIKLIIRSANKALRFFCDIYIFSTLRFDN